MKHKQHKLYKATFVDERCFLDIFQEKMGFLFWDIIRGICSLWSLPKKIYNIHHKVKYGFSEEETWCPPYYIAEYISNITYHLTQTSLYPPDTVSEKDWAYILNTIRYTFQTIQDILEDKKMYIPTTTKNWYQEYNRLKKVSKACRNGFDDNKLSIEFESYWYVMTYKECRRYENGWDYFHKYFFNLWH